MERLLSDLLVLLLIPDESWKCFCIEKDIVNVEKFSDYCDNNGYPKNLEELKVVINRIKEDCRD